MLENEPEDELRGESVDPKPPDHAGIRNGVALAFAVAALLGYFASQAQFRKSERAFRDHGEFVPWFPFQPPPPFRPTPDSVGGPQAPATQGDTYKTEHHEAAMDSKSLEATLDDIARLLKKGAGR